MNIAVLGTGMVGQAIAGRLYELGHDVVVGTRDPEATLARTEPDGMGNPPFSAWHADHPGVALATFADAAAGAELVVNATSRRGRPRRARRWPAPTTWPARCSSTSPTRSTSPQGFPPTLFVKDTDSLGEQIQRAFPEAKVVKTLNTLTAVLMVDPKSLGESSTIFVSGDDAEAKATVIALLESFGHDDVIDLGDTRDRPRHRDAAAGLAAPDGRARHRARSTSRSSADDGAHP